MLLLATYGRQAAALTRERLIGQGRAVCRNTAANQRCGAGNLPTRWRRYINRPGMPKTHASMLKMPPPPVSLAFQHTCAPTLHTQVTQFYAAGAAGAPDFGTEYYEPSDEEVQVHLQQTQRYLQQQVDPLQYHIRAGARALASHDGASVGNSQAPERTPATKPIRDA
eukprot:363446-Chlamydomonas_euryale.AAC.17